MLENPLLQSRRSPVRDPCHRPGLPGAWPDGAERNLLLPVLSVLAPDLAGGDAEAPVGEATHQTLNRRQPRHRPVIRQWSMSDPRDVGRQFAAD